MDLSAAGLLFPLFLLSLLLLYRAHLLDSVPRMLIAFSVLLGAFLLRWRMFDHETPDYQVFLADWVQFFRDNGGFRALAVSIGNYNVPYLYFLAAFSYLPIRDLFLIKALSVLFDVLLADAVMRLVGHFRSGAKCRLTAFLVTLWLPTVLLNGAYWGQCDSIYAAFALWSLYLALEDRPWLSMIVAALSFAFKLQAVFFLPVFAVLLIAGKIKLPHFLAFPAAYALVVLPAVIAGRPFWNTVTLYFSQIGSTGGGLNYNSPSVFALLPGALDVRLWSRIGIAAAFVFILLLLALCLARRRRLDDTAIVLCALLLTVGIPFFLPHMHDRYFFIADVLSAAAAFVLPGMAIPAALVSFASLLGYHAYLRQRYLLLMEHGSRALIVVLLIAAAVLLYRLLRKEYKYKKDFK